MKDKTKEKETEERGTSELTRLLCCPFCGGEAEYSEPIMIGTAFFTIECKKCGIKTPKYSSKKKLNLFWNRREIKNSLIAAYENYIALLDDELQDLVGLAHTNGWKSDRVEEGKKARKQIENIKEKAT